uniref:Uncharacterized protein n=1 Tax=Hyaloperonospora arabidopsidis (strain Emoy2) TaxID=559515 RepID=M4BK62_HYAAE
MIQGFLCWVLDTAANEDVWRKLMRRASSGSLNSTLPRPPDLAAWLRQAVDRG